MEIHTFEWLKLLQATYVAKKANDIPDADQRLYGPDDFLSGLGGG